MSSNVGASPSALSLSLLPVYISAEEASKGERGAIVAAAVVNLSHTQTMKCNEMKCVTGPFLSGLCYGPVHVGFYDPWTFVGRFL